MARLEEGDEVWWHSAKGEYTTGTVITDESTVFDYSKGYVVIAVNTSNGDPMPLVMCKATSVHLCGGQAPPVDTF